MFVLNQEAFLYPAKSLSDSGFLDSIRSMVAANRRHIIIRAFIGLGWLTTALVGVLLGGLAFEGSLAGLGWGLFGMVFLGIATAWLAMGLWTRATSKRYQRLLHGPEQHELKAGRIQELSKWIVKRKHKVDLRLLTWKDQSEVAHQAFVDVLLATHLYQGAKVIYAQDRSDGSTLLLGA